jgi:hypothetical protein
MIKKLSSVILLAAFISLQFDGCTSVKGWFGSSQGQATLQAVEQFVISEAGQFYNGALTAQQLINDAKAKFSGIALSDIMDIVNRLLADPQVFAKATASSPQHLMARPITNREKADITAAAYQCGKLFAAVGGQDATHAKALLARRTGYKYRVVTSKVKATTDAGFNQGASATNP